MGHSITGSFNLDAGVNGAVTVDGTQIVTLPSTTLVYITAAGNTPIIVGLTGGTRGRYVVLYNASGGSVAVNVTPHSDSSATKIVCNALVGVNTTIGSALAMQFVYSDTLKGWVIAGRGG